MSRMKNVLILSCSTGQGHNSCARAIEEYFENHGTACEVQDALDFISKRISHVISNGHSWIYRHMPGLFRWGYRYSEKHPAVFKEASVVYKLLTSGAERMYEYIAEGMFDTIICTHVFSAMILTHILKAHPMNVKTAFIATDYICNPGTEASNLQHYFIPDDSLTEDYTKCGIPKERMIASGIPVRHDFWKRTETSDAKRLLGISAKHKHLLVTCGSMGCGPIPKIVRRISKAMTSDLEVSVICGTNRHLEKKLKRQCAKNSRIHIIGYTNQMSLYLDSADLYLTKPGGISVTEAAIKKLPMAFVNAVAGCESYNMNFFIQKGAAFTADSPEKLAKESLRILHSDKEIIRMKKAMLEYNLPNGAAYIFQKMNRGVLI